MLKVENEKLRKKVVENEEMRRKVNYFQELYRDKHRLKRLVEYMFSENLRSSHPLLFSTLTSTPPSLI